MLGLFKVSISLSDGTAHTAEVGHADLFAFERTYDRSSAELFTGEGRLEWTAFVAHHALKRRGAKVAEWEEFRDHIDVMEIQEWNADPKD